MLVLADGEAFHALLQNQAGDALCALGLVSHTEDDENICIACVGDEDLGAVYQIVVALVFESGLLASCVSSCIGLGQTESAEFLTGAEIREIFLLLLFGTELINRPCAKGGMCGNCNTSRCANLGNFLYALCIGNFVKSCSAVLLRERNTKKSHLSHYRNILFRESLLLVELSCDRSAGILSKITIHVYHILMDLVIKEIHKNRPPFFAHL